MVDDHKSIGEVLEVLQAEFPDLTISKIRFLENQGLIAPERTPSGYRKFRDADLKQLRWVLEQQAENYLPLRVIKEQLEAAKTPAPESARPSRRPSRATPSTASDVSAAEEPRSSKSEVKAKSASVKKPVKRSSSKQRRSPSAQLEMPLIESLAAEISADIADTGVSMNRKELLKATGLSDADFKELQRYNLLGDFTVISGEELYDERSLLIAQTAKAFFDRGMDARHLRMYKQFAQRESGVFEQLFLNLKRRRSSESRAEMRKGVLELAKLGSKLRAAYLQEAFEPLTG